MDLLKVQRILFLDKENPVWALLKVSLHLVTKVRLAVPTEVYSLELVLEFHGSDFTSCILVELTNR